jgi:hypothetical protein
MVHLVEMVRVQPQEMVAMEIPALHFRLQVHQKLMGPVVVAVVTTEPVEPLDQGPEMVEEMALVVELVLPIQVQVAVAAEQEMDLVAAVVLA